MKLDEVVDIHLSPFHRALLALLPKGNAWGSLGDPSPPLALSPPFALLTHMMTNIAKRRKGDERLHPRPLLTMNDTLPTDQAAKFFGTRSQWHNGCGMRMVLPLHSGQSCRVSAQLSKVGRQV